jgi:DNA gyrase subunit A
VVVVRECIEDDEIICTSKEGMIIRIPVKDIPLQGRNTMGARVMRLNENDRVQAVTKLITEKVADEAAATAPPVVPHRPEVENEETDENGNGDDSTETSDDDDSAEENGDAKPSKKKRAKDEE